MAKRLGFVAIFFLIVSLLFCYAAYAQEQQPPPTEEEQPPPIPPGDGQEAATGYIYLYRDGVLVQVERDVMGGSQMVEFTMIELLTGPSDEEKAAGYTTYIPDGVKLQYTTIKQDRSEFSVNLSRELLSLSGDKESSTMALAQIVKTIRDVSGIESIGITIAGEAMGDTPQDAYEAMGVSREDVENEIQGLEPSSGSSTWLVLVIVLGVLVAGILLFLAIYFLNKRKAARGEPAKNRKTADKSKAGKKAKK